MTQRLPLDARVMFVIGPVTLCLHDAPEAELREAFARLPKLLEVFIKQTANDNTPGVPFPRVDFPAEFSFSTPGSDEVEADGYSGPARYWVSGSCRERFIPTRECANIRRCKGLTICEFCERAGL